MVDSITNPAAAANAYANTSKVLGAPGAGAADKASFGDILRDTASSVIQTLRGGETATASAVVGDASLPQVVGAVNAAELTLQTVVAVRDRLINAYQEIMRMPI
jgi:flagellar hook-basal body complex protein FliE